MSKNYDNWERLVTAVVRRERDREIALNQSRDTSTPSSTTSSTSNHSLRSTSDHHSLVSRIPEDYPDLRLDHAHWKKMLTPGKKEVIWRSSSLSYFLDQETGKNCFLVGAANLVLSSGDGSENCWRNIYHPDSRYSEVAELLDSRHLYIEGVIKTVMLSPETLYAAYLVFGFTENYTKVHSAVSIIRNFDESCSTYPEEQARIVKFEQGIGRADGWMDIELGDFYVGRGENGEAQVQLLDTSGYWKRGLIVEGLEIRPSESLVLRNRRQLPEDYSDLTLGHAKWKAMLLPDKQEVVWRSASMSFFLSQGTQKNCFLLGAASLIMSSTDGQELLFERKSDPKSRFSEVVELIPSRFLDIQGRIIKTKMLSPETSYAAYLVFQLTENNARPQTANSIIRICYDEDNYYPTRQARLVRKPQIVQFEAGYVRADEWMEIQLGDFYVGLGDNEEVLVQVWNFSNSWTSHLVIEGIEYRPLE